jgi:hypothetical protein
MRAGKTPKRQHTNRGEPKHRSPERRRKVSDEDTLVHGKKRRSLQQVFASVTWPRPATNS